MEIKINANLGKGEVVEPNKDGVLVVDTGALPIKEFDGITNIDDACRRAISLGSVDHHSIDMLLAGTGQPQKCATQMVVDYFGNILQYCQEHDVKEIKIHEDTDLDALCAAWLIQKGIKDGKLPKIAPQMAKIVNQVDYAEYRLPVNEYVKSFPGCVEAMLSGISGDRKGEIFSNPANIGENGRLTNEAFAKLLQVDNIANTEAFCVLDAIAAEAEINPIFNLEKLDAQKFIENSNLVSDYAKEQMNNELKETAQAQEQFEQDIKDAKIVEFNFMNPETKKQEIGKMVIVQSRSPLTATNLGYARFGKNTIMAVYGGSQRKNGDMYDIGIAPESSSMLGDVMKQICITMNRSEAQKREQARRICDGLEQLTETTPKEQERLTGLKKGLQELADMPERKAFADADNYGLIDKDPSPLVLRNTLVPASRHSLVTMSEFIKELTRWAANTKGNMLDIQKSR